MSDIDFNNPEERQAARRSAQEAGTMDEFRAQRNAWQAKRQAELRAERERKV